MKKDLQKVASDLNVQLLNGLFKQADIASDHYAKYLTQRVVPITNYGAIPGAIHGAMTKTTDEDITKMNESPIKSSLPGVADSRIIRKFKRLSGGGKNLNAHILAEKYGDIARSTAAGIVGAVIGGIVGAGKGAGGGKLGVLSGGAMGTILGGLVGTGASKGADTIATAVAGLTKGRTLQEQKEHDDKSSILSWLTPGGEYNYWKRVGVVGRGEREAEVNARLKKALATAKGDAKDTKKGKKAEA